MRRLRRRFLADGRREKRGEIGGRSGKSCLLKSDSAKVRSTCSLLFHIYIFCVTELENSSLLKNDVLLVLSDRLSLVIIVITRRSSATILF